MSKRDYIKHYSSPNEPSDAQAGDEWYNTATNKLYKRLIDSGTTTRWLELSQDRTVSSGTSSAISAALAATPSAAIASIVTIAGTNLSNRISFSNIPLTYKNLQLTGSVATTYNAQSYYLCVDFYKNGSRLPFNWMFYQFYSTSGYNGTYGNGQNYAYFWYGGGYTTSAGMAGAIQILFADYVNQIGSQGTMSYNHGYSAAPHISNFSFVNGVSRQGFDRFDLYWTTSVGSDAGTQYWTTDTKLTLYGLL